MVIMESGTCESVPVFHALKDRCAQFNNKWNPSKPLIWSQLIISAWKAVEEKCNRFQENCLQMFFSIRIVRIHLNIQLCRGTAGLSEGHDHLSSVLSNKLASFIVTLLVTGKGKVRRSVVLFTNVPELRKVLRCQSFFQLRIACKFKLVQST